MEHHGVTIEQVARVIGAQGADAFARLAGALPAVGAKYGNLTLGHIEAVLNAVEPRLNDLLAGDVKLEFRQVLKDFFDRNGRRFPLNLRAAVCDPNSNFKLARQEKVDFTARLYRLADALEMAVPISAVQFEDETGKLIELVKTVAGGRCANVLKGVCLPAIVPLMPDADYGLALKDVYLKALQRAYKKAYPDRAFVNHQRGELANQVKIAADTRHDQFMAKAKQGWQVILFFPNPLQGFSVLAQREQLAELPEEFSLAGGIDGLPAWTMWVDVLARDYQTPGLDFSALQWQASACSLYVNARDGSADFDSRGNLGHARGHYSGGLSFAR